MAYIRNILEALPKTSSADCLRGASHVRCIFGARVPLFDYTLVDLNPGVLDSPQRKTSGCKSTLKPVKKWNPASRCVEHVLAVPWSKLRLVRQALCSRARLPETTEQAGRAKLAPYPTTFPSRGCTKAISHLGWMKPTGAKRTFCLQTHFHLPQLFAARADPEPKPFSAQTQVPFWGEIDGFPWMKQPGQPGIAIYFLPSPRFTWKLPNGPRNGRQRPIESFHVRECTTTAPSIDFRLQPRDPSPNPALGLPPGMSGSKSVKGSWPRRCRGEARLPWLPGPSNCPEERVLSSATVACFFTRPPAPKMARPNFRVHPNKSSLVLYANLEICGGRAFLVLRRA